MNEPLIMDYTSSPPLTPHSARHKVRNELTDNIFVGQDGVQEQDEEEGGVDEEGEGAEPSVPQHGGISHDSGLCTAWRHSTYCCNQQPPAQTFQPNQTNKRNTLLERTL